MYKTASIHLRVVKVANNLFKEAKQTIQTILETCKKLHFMLSQKRRTTIRLYFKLTQKSVTNHKKYIPYNVCNSLVRNKSRFCFVLIKDAKYNEAAADETFLGLKFDIINSKSQSMS